MRNKSSMALTVLILLMVAPAFGQKRLTADIPFAFRVGSVIMPAGQYDLNRSFNNLGGVLTLECHGCRSWMSSMTYTIGPHNGNAAARLVFTKYREVYYLSEVWPASGVGSTLLKSKAEHEAMRDASLAPTRQVVLATP